MKAGDIILSVGGKEMVRGDMKPQEFSGKVSEALRGEPGLPLFYGYCVR